MSIAKRIHAARAAGRNLFGSASNADPIIGSFDHRHEGEKLREQVRKSPRVAAVVQSLFADLEPLEDK